MGLKAAIESTNQLVHCNGLPCRIWRGVTEQGTEAIFYVAHLDVLDNPRRQHIRPPPRASWPDEEAEAIPTTIPTRIVPSG